MAYKTFRYAAIPVSDSVADSAWDAIQVCREVYNHIVTQVYRPAPADAKPSFRELQRKLPEWKEQWPAWTRVYSRCLLMAVKRVVDAHESQQEQPHTTGSLTWKKPHEYQSVTYNQSGFDVTTADGDEGEAILSLSKIGKFRLVYHRPLPDGCTIKQVTLKKESSGDWFVSVTVSVDGHFPEPPAAEQLSTADVVGLDVGVTTYIHDSDGRAIQPLDEEGLRDRIARRHRSLSRKEYDSANWHEARESLARAYQRLTARRRDYREKLAHAYTTAYDAVVVEDLSIVPLIQSGESNSVADRAFGRLQEAMGRHGQKHGCHVVTVDAHDTSKQCARCGVKTDKQIWVREHSCPSCGITADRDYNAACEIKRRGMETLGVPTRHVGPGRSESTPAETVFPVDSHDVSAKHVLETGTLPPVPSAER